MHMPTKKYFVIVIVIFVNCDRKSQLSGILTEPCIRYKIQQTGYRVALDTGHRIMGSARYMLLNTGYRVALDTGYRIQGSTRYRI